ncbi:MAG: hypothetical protein HYW22_00715 [Candidatus Aenigmarchaeota archaeon]|nr:hypothetical protein [Candidatus Aenigmarchaeota archaeon]
MRRRTIVGVGASALLTLGLYFGIASNRNNSATPTQPVQTNAVATQTVAPSVSPTIQTTPLIVTPTPIPIPTPTIQVTAPVVASQSPSPTPYQSRFGSFYLSSPCVNCNLTNRKLQAGYNIVEITLSRGSNIIYSGENGYYVSYGSGATADELTIFDNSGYAISYLVSKGSILVPQGPVEIKRGQKVAIAGEHIDTLSGDSNVAVRLKYFPDKVRGFQEIKSYIETPYKDVFVEDFR